MNDEPSAMGTIRWSAYLGCSWTWCIGMFMPALMVRDFGFAGFLVFAVPNIIGAGLMGWVLTSKAQSIKMVRDHANAIGWFSIVTIAFHVFWIVWLFSYAQGMIPIPDEYLFGAGAIAVAWAIVTSRGIRMGRESQLALVLWVFSVVVLVLSFTIPDAISPTTREVIGEVNQQSMLQTGVLWMIPLSVFGFALCPYLDSTFHHARQRLGSPSHARAGFTLGFGLMFATMLVMTYQYSGLIIRTLEGNTDSISVHPLIGAGILAHIMCQWIFTVRVHLDRLPKLPGGGPALPLTFGVAILAGVLALIIPRIANHADLNAGEIVYRNFLGAYGLLFPAYILYRIVRARKQNRPTKSFFMWLAIGIAAPMFWVGFIERATPLLTLGVVILIAMSFLPRENQATQTAA